MSSLKMTCNDHRQLRREQEQMARNKEMDERLKRNVSADENRDRGAFKQEEEMGTDHPEVVRTNKKRDPSAPTPKSTA